MTSTPHIALTDGSWSDLGVGPLSVEVLSAGNAWIIVDTALPPTNSTDGQLLALSLGYVQGTFGSATTHVYARAAAGSAVIAVAPGQAGGGGAVQNQPFLPIGPAKTPGLTVATAATGGSATAVGTGLVCPTVTATSYRLKNDQSSSGKVAWTLGDGTAVPVLTIPFNASNGTSGGTLGDEDMDPGGVEVFQLSAAQQTLLAAGALRLRAVGSAAAVISITFGTGT